MSDLDLGLSFLLNQSAASVMVIFWCTLFLEVPRYGFPFIAMAIAGLAKPAKPSATGCLFQVPKGVSQVVITSDGYPRILPSLQQSEDLLARLLAEDPLCIGPLRSTKGVKPGNASFDDRAYLRIRL